jgi:hypothetical protein
VADSEASEEEASEVSEEVPSVVVEQVEAGNLSKICYHPG